MAFDPFSESVEPSGTAGVLGDGCFRSSGFKAASADLIFARLSDRPGATLIVGRPGSGKTVLLQSLLADPGTGDKPLMITVSPSFSVEDFVACCVQSFGRFDLEGHDPGRPWDGSGEGVPHDEGAAAEPAPVLPSVADLTNFLVRRGLTKGPVTLLIDSAGQLRPDLGRVLLDLAVRAKHGRRLIHVVLALDSSDLDSSDLDSSDLEKAVAESLYPDGEEGTREGDWPETESFLSEIEGQTAFRCDLPPFTEEEVGDYIAHRLKTAGYPGERLFSKSAIAAIAEEAQGLPTQINRLCSRTLAIWAQEDDQDRGLVTLRHVVQAVMGEPDEATDPAVASGSQSKKRTTKGQEIETPSEWTVVAQGQGRKDPTTADEIQSPRRAGHQDQKAGAMDLPVELGGSWDWELPPDLLKEAGTKLRESPLKGADRDSPESGRALRESDLFMDPPQEVAVQRPRRSRVQGDASVREIQQKDGIAQAGLAKPSLDRPPGPQRRFSQPAARPPSQRRYWGPAGLVVAVLVVLLAGGWLASPQMAGSELDAKLEAISSTLRLAVADLLGPDQEPLAPSDDLDARQVASDQATPEIDGGPPLEGASSAVKETGDQAGDATAALGVGGSGEQKLGAAMPLEDDVRANETRDPAILDAPLTAASLLEQGDLFLALKNLGAARTAYQEAVSFGSAQAQTAMGKTYDPLELEARGLDRGLSNPQLARSWYMRGMEAGDAAAADLLDTLDAIEPARKLDP